MNNAQKQALKAHAAMLVFAFLVSTSFTIGKTITYALDPAALTFLRFSLAVVIFIIILTVSRDRLGFPGLKSWPRYLFLALLLVIFFVTMFEGLRWTTSLAAGAVFTLVPFLTAIVALIFFGQKMKPVSFTSLLVASLASVWIMFGGDLEALMSLKLGKGELIFLVGCISYAGYTPAVQKLHKGDRVIHLTLWTIFAGAILLLIYGSQAILETQWHLVPSYVYLSIGWLATFTTAVTFYLIQYAAVRLPSVKVMAYTLLIPVFILLQQLVGGGSWPDLSVMIALGVLSAAMLVLQRG